MLITTPQILSATANKVNSEATIDVRTTISTNTMEVLNKTIPYMEKTRIETFGNGTSKAWISLNYTFERKSICISMEKVIYPKIIPETKVSVAKYSYIQTSGVWPSKRRWDNLTFLLPGNNGSAVVTYEHDDNYDTYYPAQWFARYTLTGVEKDHIHIPTDVMTDWYNRVVDRRTVVGIVFGLSGGVMAILTGILAAFVNPVAAFMTICAGIASIIGWILALLGFTEQNWIRDVITEKYSGDGWTWIWGENVTETRMWLDWPWINPYNGIFSNEECARIWQYHRVGIGVCDSMEFYQSWGSQRDSPDKYSIDVYGDMYVNPGAICENPGYSR